MQWFGFRRTSRFPPTFGPHVLNFGQINKNDFLSTFCSFAWKDFFVRLMTTHIKGSPFSHRSFVETSLSHSSRTFPSWKAKFGVSQSVRRINFDELLWEATWSFERICSQNNDRCCASVYELFSLSEWRKTKISMYKWCCRKRAARLSIQESNILFFMVCGGKKLVLTDKIVCFQLGVRNFGWSSAGFLGCVNIPITAQSCFLVDRRNLKYNTSTSAISKSG